MHELAKSNSHGRGGTDVWPLAVKEWFNPAGVLTVTAPYDGELVAKVETAGIQHLQKSLEAAYRLFKNRDGWLPLAERIGVLERTARIMLREKDALATTAAREGGKPLIDS